MIRCVICGALLTMLLNKAITRSYSAGESVFFLPSVERHCPLHRNRGLA